MINWIMVLGLIMGDSHAEGAPGEYLQKIMSSRGYETTVLSKVGLRITTMAKQTLLFEEAKLQVIIMGTNDSPTRATRSAYARVAADYPEAYLVGPPKYKGHLGSRTDRVAEIQRQVFGDRWIDSRPCTSDMTGRVGIHFTKDGAKTWIDCVIAEIDRRRK
jgi:hypothetical protein